MIDEYMINHMNGKILIFYLIFSITVMTPVYSQNDSIENPNELIVSDQDLIIIFSSFIDLTLLHQKALFLI